MAQVISNAHIDIMIDGHRVQGLANEDRPFEYGDGSGLFNIERSEADGGLYATTNAGAIIGGPFTLRLQPNSPTAAWLIERKMELKDAVENNKAIRIFTITLSDNHQGRKTRFEGCLLDTCPDQTEANTTFEVMFECEKIVSNNAGAQFRAPYDNGTAVAA